jgi:oxidase EvaA
MESEQGTRFLGKLNRNMSVLLDVEPPLEAPLRWAETAALLRLLDQDFVVNTDARSVLTGMPWEFLAANGPFVGATGAMGEDLRMSFTTAVTTERLAAVDDRLAGARHYRQDPQIVRLDRLRGWDVRPDGTVSSTGSPLRVIHVRVASRSREVSQWDQPLLENRATAMADLCATRIGGVMRFGFAVRPEPGLARGAELGPTTLGERASDRPNGHESGHVVMSCRQSDEGGRFFRDVTVYRIVDLGGAEPDPDKIWLSVSEIRALLSRGGYFTNEARTLISLLMRYLVP